VFVAAVALSWAAALPNEEDDDDRARGAAGRSASCALATPAVDEDTPAPAVEVDALLWPFGGADDSVLPPVSAARRLRLAFCFAFTSPSSSSLLSHRPMLFSFRSARRKKIWFLKIDFETEQPAPMWGGIPSSLTLALFSSLDRRWVRLTVGRR
jgi:hypothetical protein